MLFVNLKSLAGLSLGIGSLETAIVIFPLGGPSATVSLPHELQ